ncbi:MAG TPA: DUF3224 domain-containing protein [Actinopolymorphaceae bacterium]
MHENPPVQENTFTSTSWEEERPSADEAGRPRVAHARTTNRFTGVITGSSVAHFVLYYSAGETEWGGPGTYHGYEQVTGTVDGRTGSFVLEHHGSFEGTTVRTSWTVVPGSGSGELTGLKGTGGFVATHGEPATRYPHELRVADRTDRAT